MLLKNMAAGLGRRDSKQPMDWHSGWEGSGRGWPLGSWTGSLTSQGKALGTQARSPRDAVPLGIVYTPVLSSV